MKLYPEYANRDRLFQEGDVFPDLEALNLNSHGSRMLGYMLKPGGDPTERRPVAIMLHGFPGNATNHDIAQALCRTGFLVLNPFYRGAWGSDGFYTFTGKIEDVETVANWIRSPEAAEQYRIDTDRIFLVGHSMGGYAAVNAMRRLPWIRGGVIMAPYDMPWFFENGKVDEFRSLLSSGFSLRQETADSLWENASACWQTTGFSKAFEDLKDRNLYFIGGAKDDCAPPANMIEPLFGKLQAHETAASQKYDLLNSDHCFSDMRVRLCGMICNWMASVAQCDV